MHDTLLGLWEIKYNEAFAFKDGLSTREVNLFMWTHEEEKKKLC